MATPDLTLVTRADIENFDVLVSSQFEDIRSHGAKCDGVTDDLDAITQALATARLKKHGRVYIPGGTTRIRSAILQPSYTELFGAGMRVTIIKLLDSAPVDTWVVTNSTRSTGNFDLTCRDMTLDWNQQRQGGLDGAGGSRSSCITYGNVMSGLIRRVETINAGLHGVDLTCAALDYPYDGDGAPTAAGPTRHVTVEHCVASNFGDDGITTHHCEHNTIRDNYVYNPRRRTNNNGIEIDDGSRHITLRDNITEGCYAGLEIKAHGTASAPSDIVVNGHRDTGSVRSYNFRHIGYHSGTDPYSKTARNILANNLVSINPNNDKGFQDEATPRALAISAYQGVSINGFTAIGRGTYVAGDVAVAIQLRAGDINISGMNISGWLGADTDLNITSGDRVNVTGVTISGSAKRGVYTGASVTSCHISGIIMAGPTVGATTGIDIYTTEGVDVSGITATGYPVPVRANGVNFPTPRDFYNRLEIVPDGTTTLNALNKPGATYYLSTTQYADMTDKPVGTAGAYYVKNGKSLATPDQFQQTIVRSTRNDADFAEITRIVSTSQPASGWKKYQVTAV